MPSGRIRSRPEAPPIFFLDRGLGRNIIAAALRDAGLIAITMIDVYPRGTDQRVGDDEWIARASDEGWVALTKGASRPADGGVKGGRGMQGRRVVLPSQDRIVDRVGRHHR